MLQFRTNLTFFCLLEFDVLEKFAYWFKNQYEPFLNIFPTIHNTVTYISLEGDHSVFVLYSLYR